MIEKLFVRQLQNVYRKTTSGTESKMFEIHWKETMLRRIHYFTPIMKCNHRNNATH